MATVVLEHPIYSHHEIHEEIIQHWWFSSSLSDTYFKLKFVICCL